VNTDVAITHSDAQRSHEQRGSHRQSTMQKVIAENVKALVEQLERGQSAALTAYLAAMARFHNYSFGNILSIAFHKPDATHVAGVRTWNELGRFVLKGQKGIPILAPVISQKRKQEVQPEAVEGKPRPIVIGFRRVYVFDISQTEGAELPEPAKVTGEVGDFEERLLGFVSQQGISVEYSDRIAPAQGMSIGGKIILLPGMSKAEEFSTLTHEVSHEMLHRAERRTMTTKTVRETEAEAIAFIVSQAIGLNAATASADYISLYHGNPELLAESLSVIQQASSEILSALLAEEHSEEQLAKAS